MREYSLAGVPLVLRRERRCAMQRNRRGPWRLHGGPGGGGCSIEHHRRASPGGSRARRARAGASETPIEEKLTLLRRGAPREGHQCRQ